MPIPGQTVNLFNIKNPDGAPNINKIEVPLIGKIDGQSDWKYCFPSPEPPPPPNLKVYLVLPSSVLVKTSVAKLSPPPPSILLPVLLYTGSEDVPGVALLCPGEDLCGGAALCTIAQLGKLLAEGGLQHREKGLYMNAPV